MIHKTTSIIPYPFWLKAATGQRHLLSPPLLPSRVMAAPRSPSPLLPSTSLYGRAPIGAAAPSTSLPTAHGTHSRLGRAGRRHRGVHFRPACPLCGYGGFRVTHCDDRNASTPLPCYPVVATWHGLLATVPSGRRCNEVVSIASLSAKLDRIVDLLAAQTDHCCCSRFRSGFRHVDVRLVDDVIQRQVPAVHHPA